MKSYYSVVFFMVCVLLVEAFFFGLVAISYGRRSSKFEITEDFVADRICFAVSNYLSFYLPLVTNQSHLLSGSGLDVSIKFCDSLSTWASPGRGYGCLIDGVRYGEGDYTSYGIVIRIADGRVYCRDGSSYYVLRPSPEAGESRQRLPRLGDGREQDAL